MDLEENVDRERKLNKNLNVCMSLGLLSIPILGPIGICYVGGIFVGKMIRNHARKDTKELYQTYKSKDKILKDIELKEDRDYHIKRLYLSTQTLDRYITERKNLKDFNQIDIRVNKFGSRIDIK